MKAASEDKRKPNWLMRGMIGISLVIHLLIFMHISGIYRSKALSYIELTMQDISKPFRRSIPRPRMRPKTPKIHNVKTLNIPMQGIPKQSIPRMKIDPVNNNLPDTIMQDISMSDIPDNAKHSISDWNPDGNYEFTTTNDYFDMLRFKIESCKKYPDIAKSRYIEGRVKLRFVIASDGQVSSLKVVKHARHSSLDRAALKAVKDAAPFPRPPGGVFKEPLHIEIIIVFELI